jgi:hypothetical protein
MWFNAGIVDASYNNSFGLTYNGTTYTNLYNSGTNYSSSALSAGIINNGSLVINTVGVTNKSFRFLCQVLYDDSIEITPGASFFQYTRIA